MLDAGVLLFAANGFAGTSFKDVSNESGVSMGLIQYHFPTKDALYGAVKEHAIAAYVEAQEPQFALPAANFFAFVDRGLRQYFRFFDQRPAWPRLESWAALEGDFTAFPGEHRLMDRLVERVEAARRSGELPRNVDPELLLIIIAGMMQAWLRYHTRYSSRLRHYANAARAEDAYMSLCIAMLKGLNIGRSSSTKPAGSPKRAPSRRTRSRP